MFVLTFSLLQLEAIVPPPPPRPQKGSHWLLPWSVLGFSPSPLCWLGSTEPKSCNIVTLPYLLPSLDFKRWSLAFHLLLEKIFFISIYIDTKTYYLRLHFSGCGMPLGWTTISHEKRSPYWHRMSTCVSNLAAGLWVRINNFFSTELHLHRM